MDSDELNWKIVSNTVTKRMVDSSFVHKLAPSKRLCRRTKVMNTAIRHLHSFKNYNEYIDMKTAILRNLSDDDDTDDNNDLSDTEYSLLYKSDVDLTNSAIDITTTSTHYPDSESDVSDYDISDIKKQSPNAERSKNKSSSDSVNLVLQKVVKKNVQSTCSPKKNIQKSEPNELNETNNYERSASSSEKIVCKKNIRESKPNELNGTNNNEPSASSSEKIVCKKSIEESKPNVPSASSSEKIVCKKNIRKSKPNELNGTNNNEPSASSSEKIVWKKSIRESKPNVPSASSSDEVVCKKNIRESEPNEPSTSSSDEVVCKKNIRESKPNEPSASSSEKIVCKKNIRESEPNEPSASSSDEVVCKKNIRESKPNEPSASSSDEFVCKKNIRESKLNEPSASSSDEVVCKRNIRKSEPNELNGTNNNVPSASSFYKVACKENIRESEPNEVNGTNNYEPSASSPNKSVFGKDRILPTLETCSRKMWSNKKTNSINTKQGANKNYTSSSEQVSNSSNDEVNEKLNKSNCSKKLKSKEKLNGIRKDLISFLDEETMVQHIDKHSVNTEACVRESCSRLKVKYVKVQKVSTDERTSSKSSLIQPPFNGSTNHPKDSGIDEDIEEEFHDIGRIVYAKKKKKMPEICKNTKLTSPVLNRKDASTVETTLSNADDLLSDVHDTSDTTDSQYTALVTNEGTNSGTKEENKLQKVKLQPKVTCTTVIKNKYRIISDNALLLDKCSESSINDDHISNKAMDPANIEHTAEDSMSPLSNRRLQQMRRLNLTRDSESSPSDDDNEYCNTENMRDKLFKRSKEPSDLSGSEDENMGFKHSLSLENSKKLQAHENSRFGMNRKKKNIHSEESYTDNNESIQSSKTSCNNYKDTSSETETYLLADQYKTNTRNSFKHSVRCSSNESDSAKENMKHETLSQKNHQTERISKSDETATRTIIKNSALRTRPHNLQELIDEESLVYETTLPSITLKDLQENNIFLLDIPSMVIETKLLGQKFILTENKLKLGKHKYKIALNDTNHMSCVLGAGESCTDYKAVNVKPMKKFVAYEKIVKAASEK